MSTGDLVNSLGKLENKLKQVKFKNYRRADFLSGTMDIYLAVYGYVFSSFNCDFSKSIAEKGLELYGKTNKHFVDNLYRIVRDVLYYKPSITKNMFLTNGAFVEMKMIMCTSIIDLVLQKCKDFPSGSRSHRNTRILVNRSSKNSKKVSTSVNTKHSSSSKQELDKNTLLYDQKTASRFYSREIEHNIEDASSENGIKNNYFIKPHLGKKLFHTCSALGITRNNEITQFVLPRSSMGNVILEKQKSSIENIPVSVEMGPFIEKEKIPGPLTVDKNINSIPNHVQAQCNDIQKMPKTVKCPLTETRPHRNAVRTLNSPVEINKDSLMENISQTLSESTKIPEVLLMEKVEPKAINSKILMSKENSPVLSDQDRTSDQLQDKENVAKHQTLIPTSDVDCKKELDYCIARMNLMECALKSLEYKFEKGQRL
ncbi:hypothetical protein Ahia01_000565800 [Argonauta hians]